MTNWIGSSQQGKRPLKEMIEDHQVRESLDNELTNGFPILDLHDRMDKHIEDVRQEFVRKDLLISRQWALICFLSVFVVILMGLLIFITM